MVQPFSFLCWARSMISRVVIKNFKSIGEAGVDLELKPLTFLVGPNGGGKSSILEAIAVAIQENVISRLTSFRTYDSMIHKPNASIATIEAHLAQVDHQTSGSFRAIVDTQRGITLEFVSEDLAVREVIAQLYPKLRDKTFLVSSVRGDVPHSVLTHGSASEVGVHGQQLLLLLAIIFGQRQHKDIAAKITKWARRFGVGDLNAGFRGSSEAGSDYLDTDLKAVLDLALASSGARQILTVITQLLWAQEGSLLMIEEPEISLHPQAQVDVLEMFAEAIREDNKQIIATTHSHILLQALGYAVHKEWLSSGQIAVYHVQKGKKGTRARLLPLGKHGYIKNWVPSFTKVERQLLQEWAKSLPRA